MLIEHNPETVVDSFVEDRNITLQFGATGTPAQTVKYLLTEVMNQIHLLYGMKAMTSLIQ